jgi:DNA-binding CsgD family transcriptional regulator
VRRFSYDDAVSSAPSPRLADRLADAEATALVGRTVERELLVGLLTAEPGPAIVFLHGPGGIGKTILLHGVLDRLGAASVCIDGRHVEPTPTGLLEAIAAVLGVAELRSVQDAAARLEATGTRLLAIDSYEHLGILDGWLRNDLLPALPAAMRTVTAGRNPPNHAWRTAAGWRTLIAEQLLGPLSEADAALLLRRRALPEPVVARALRFGRGHPLALELIAEALSRRPDLHVRAGPPPEVVEELVDVIFEGLPPDARHNAERASVLRRVTEPLLAAVLADDAADGPQRAVAWRMLRDLPFTSVTPYGLEFSAVIHEVIATALELRNPGLACELRRRAARAALAQVGRSAGWGPTADLLHLVQNPIIRAAFVPPEGFQHPVEYASADDREEVLAIVERHQGRASSQLAARWWTHHRHGFVVSRGSEGEVTAMSVVIEAPQLHESLSSDPVAAAVLADLRTRPLRAGERALFNRFALSARCGSEPSPELAPMLIDIKRTYLELRPDLARVYVIRAADSAITDMMRALGFRQLAPAIEIDGVFHDPCVLDFGPGSVDAWLARLIEAETSAPTADSEPVPPTTAAPVGRPPSSPVARLSPREREVLAALAEGLSNNELAERLFISERTANRHLSNIFTKLGVHNRTAAARIAIDAGVVA